MVSFLGYIPLLETTKPARVGRTQVKGLSNPDDESEDGDQRDISEGSDEGEEWVGIASSNSDKVKTQNHTLGNGSLDPMYCVGCASPRISSPVPTDVVLPAGAYVPPPLRALQNDAAPSESDVKLKRQLKVCSTGGGFHLRCPLTLNTVVG